MGNSTMKKLLLLLLFIPLFVFAQFGSEKGELTYKELMSINSMETFLKVMIENNYTKFDTSSTYVGFSLNPNEEGLSSSFAYYFTTDNRFEFTFTRTGTMYKGTPREREGVIENTYDNIFEIIKRRCRFDAAKTIAEETYACYKCRQAKFDGLIGLRSTGLRGIITAFANKKDWDLNR